MILLLQARLPHCREGNDTSKDGAHRIFNVADRSPRIHESCCNSRSGIDHGLLRCIGQIHG